jgi:hypothetical protein
MKKLFFIMCLLAGVTITCPPAGRLAAQAPHRFNYQAVARNAAGSIIDSQHVSVRFTLKDSVLNGAVLYQETQLLTTNHFGLITAQVGNGTAAQGNIDSIPWGTNNKYLQVELDATGGSNYVDMGTSQMLSVPYALYAEKSGGVTGSYRNVNANLGYATAVSNLNSGGDYFGTSGFIKNLDSTVVEMDVDFSAYNGTNSSQLVSFRLQIDSNQNFPGFYSNSVIIPGTSSGQFLPCHLRAVAWGVPAGLYHVSIVGYNAGSGSVSFVSTNIFGGTTVIPFMFYEHY